MTERQEAEPRREGAGEGGEEERSAKRGQRVYAEEEVRERLKALPGWYLEDGWIRRKYNTDGWPTTLMLVGLIGYLSEQAWHHPDLSVTWGKVWVKIQNHAAGGITDKCFELARRIEEAALWRPGVAGVESALEGTPHKFVRGGDPK